MRPFPPPIASRATPSPSRAARDRTSAGHCHAAFGLRSGPWPNNRADASRSRSAAALDDGGHHESWRDWVGRRGSDVGCGVLEHGHEIEIGTREPAKLKEWSTKHPGAKVKTFAEAAAFGEALVLAVAGQVGLEALKLVGPKALQGKTVIDACNSTQSFTKPKHSLACPTAK